MYLDHTLKQLTGVIAHGYSNLALGSPKGVQIHLPLKRGEHLTSAWLHMRGYYYAVLDCFSVSHCLFLHILLADWTPNTRSRRIMGEYVTSATTRLFDSIVACRSLEAMIPPAVGYA